MQEALMTRRYTCALPPVTWEPSPKGRDQNAVALYRVMRWNLRVNRLKFYRVHQQALQAQHDAMVYGTGQLRVAWENLSDAE